MVLQEFKKVIQIMFDLTLLLLAVGKTTYFY